MDKLVRDWMEGSMLPRLLVGVATSAVLVTSNVAAAEIELVGTNGNGLSIVRVVGDLVEGDVETFSSVTNNLDQAIVLFASNGGNLRAGLDIGARIRMRGYSAAVADGQECHSACAIAWLGGVRRFLGTGARISFHAAYLVEDGVARETGLGNALIGAYATKLGLEHDAIVFLTSAPPDGFNELDQNWADNIGLTVQFGTTSELVSIKPEAFTGSGSSSGDVALLISTQN